MGTRFEGVIHRACEKTGKRLRSLFGDTPYEIIRDMETHYRNVVWLLFKLMGFYTQAEYRISDKTLVG